LPRTSRAQDDPRAWARQVLGKVRDWLGSGVALPGVNTVQQRRSALTRAIEAAAAQLAQDQDARLGEVITGLMDHAGRRLAVAEAAITRLIQFCDEATREHQVRVKMQADRSARAQELLDAALEGCLNSAGGWSFFGGRGRRAVRVFVDHLAAYARQCLAEDTSAAVLQFLAHLRGRLGDRLRDLGLCRQRLRYLQETLEHHVDTPEGDVDNVADTMTFTRNAAASYSPAATWGTPAAAQLSPTPLLSTEAYWETIRESTTNRVVLPDGETDLDRSARRFLATLTPEHWCQLDQAIGDSVLAPNGGLLKLCLDNHDLVRSVGSPLLNQAITCLSDHLPITDVAQVEFSLGDGIADRLLGYRAAALPMLPLAEAKGVPNTRTGHPSGSRRLVVGVGGRGGNEPPADPRLPPSKKPSAEDQSSFLLIPASEAGKSIGETAREILPELHLVNVPGQADLMFCREQAALTIEDLERMLHLCRNAYQELSMVPHNSPHARFDIQDWSPLDP
jgi:hypothetical protein